MKIGIFFLLAILTTPIFAQTSIMEELGYISLQQVTFGSVSYLASQDKWYGKQFAGGFDAFMSVAGVNNALVQESGIQSIGYYLLSAGFFAKSFYNFKYAGDRTSKEVFWVNYIGYNILVYFGYFLDSIK
ncbi:MAG: hypothetical protein ISR83_01290 [Candidatus Marinimicrobia bacterium]|nr:hypothetical protein [Candidatus Neomarinimicrobiota bacterium]